MVCGFSVKGTEKNHTTALAFTTRGARAGARGGDGTQRAVLHTRTLAHGHAGGGQILGG